MDSDILFLWEGRPLALALYAQLEGRLLERYPGMQIRTTKTQVSFSNRYIFALASPPKRKKEDHLVVSFGLGYEKRSPRIFCAAEAARNRWTHHVAVRTPEELDAELFGWLDEAYAFSAAK